MRSHMSYRAKRELLLQIAPRYREASSVLKEVILDEFVAATGYARKYAIRLLNHTADPKLTITRPRPPHYGPEVQQALHLACTAANHICAKRLMPFLTTLVESLQRHGHLPLLNRGQEAVVAALKRAQQLLPFPLLGIDTDNGAEFINMELMMFCEQEHITFTRGRPRRSNDQCYVEQKNGQIVRQVVGYDRFVGELAYRQLTELYRALRLYVNCFQPRVLLQAKQREGSKLRRTYDEAQTPMQRLLVSEALPANKQQELLRITQALDPLRLLQQLEHATSSAVAPCRHARSCFESRALFHPPIFSE